MSSNNSNNSNNNSNNSNNSNNASACECVTGAQCPSGCMTCGTHMPSWWILMESDLLLTTPMSEVEEWLQKTETYIKDGYCSFECYKKSIPFECDIKPGERVSYTYTQYMNNMYDNEEKPIPYEDQFETDEDRYRFERDYFNSLHRRWKKSH